MTRILFKKIGNVKEIFHPKMGKIKDRNYRDLVDAEEYKIKWKEYMEGLYKRSIDERVNNSGVVRYPEPDIMECEVKWALRSTDVDEASGCDGIPVELFKTLKDDVIKVLNSVYQQIWKAQQWPRD